MIDAQECSLCRVEYELPQYLMLTCIPIEFGRSKYALHFGLQLIWSVKLTYVQGEDSGRDVAT